MSIEQLFTELKKLNRLDKLRAMQFLIAEVSAEEGLHPTADARYELPTPYDNEAADQTLNDFLHSENHKGEK